MAASGHHRTANGDPRSLRKSAILTDIDLNPASSKIVKSLIALCQDMQLECIVEGVETTAELGALKNLGCTRAQGYLFPRAMRAGDIDAWLAAEQLAKV